MITVPFPIKLHDLYLKIQGKKSVTFPLTYSWHVLYNEHKIDKGQGNVCMYVCVGGPMYYSLAKSHYKSTSCKLNQYTGFSLKLCLS